jgi:hypothetical protein
MTTSVSVKTENARLYIRKGYSNPKIGITPGMDVGHLYHVDNNLSELIAIAAYLGLSPKWIQNKPASVSHYDIYGLPLKTARKIIKVVAKEELIGDIHRIEDAIKHDLEKIQKESIQEYINSEPILVNIGYKSFFSRSKGRAKNSAGQVIIKDGKAKRLPRKVWKEVELYRYIGKGWHGEKHFPFDTILTEVTGNRMDLKLEEWGDTFKHYIKDHCTPKGGKNQKLV